MRKFRYILWLLILAGMSLSLQAQDLRANLTENKLLDSLRKKEQGGNDTVVYTAKFIRFTNLRLLKDSIQTLPLDTSIQNIQNFNPLYQPKNPTAHTGNTGLAARALLFQPSKTIGFDVGFNNLNWYELKPEDLLFYQARSPFTSLQYFNGSIKDEILKVTHSQNIKPNWNIGANFNRYGANGFYTRQRGDHLNASLFNWYQSKNKRYNLLAAVIFNTLKAQENGSVENEQIFADEEQKINRDAEAIRLKAAHQLYRKNYFFMKHSYFVGRIDSTLQDSASRILPTNRIDYTFTYQKSQYGFFNDGADPFKVMPKGRFDEQFTKDSSSVHHFQNTFMYTFFLRGQKASMIKNELKLDVGLQHDFYKYSNMGIMRDGSRYLDRKQSFQNLSLLGNLGYRFSNRIDLNFNVQQIVQGRHAGDFLYEAKSNLLLSKAVGRIVLGAYLQNQSQNELYQNQFGNHYQWSNNLDKTKIAQLSFNFINDRYAADIGLNYFLIDNYTFLESADGSFNFLPTQLGHAVNLIQLKASKRFTLGAFNLESFVAYQKTDAQNTLRIPEIYTFNSFYYKQTFFKVLKTRMGFDLRYNTSYKAVSYAPALAQFYNGADVVFGSHPIVDVWISANLKRANLFLKYDYANQKLFSKGYYTVNRYPMPDALLKFGVIWNFYD